ncbi:MAG: radical SAM protein [Candidatus Aenigmatarchaeota archaeon]
MNPQNLTFKINEIFGPTIQGEGPLVGVNCLFIRFSGCDYRCSFCDTKYSYENFKEMTLNEILRVLKRLSKKTRTVVLTGGNPCLQDLGFLIDKLKENHYYVNVETQGSIFPYWLNKVDLVVLSPKPPSSNSPFDITKFLAGISSLHVPYVIKIVINTEKDFKWFKSLYKKCFKNSVVYLQVCTHPTDSPLEILKNYKKLVKKVLDEDQFEKIFILPQLHVLGDLK